MQRKILVGFLLLALTSCATDRSFGGAGSVEIADLDSLPEPAGEIFYSIGPQEALEIVVVGAEDLSGTFLTDEKGDLIFPYIGRVNTGNKTPQEAAALISQGLAGRVVRDPQVRVIPEEFPEPSISVGGQVERPGAYPAIGKPTLLRVVNMAQGLDQYAKKDDVLIMRTVEGQRYIGLYNIEAIERGNYEDPPLYPNDIVMVGDSPARRRFDNILQLAPILTSSVILIDRVGR